MSTNDTLTQARAGAEQVLARTQETTRRVADEVRAKTEPTAEQIADAVNELIAWSRRSAPRNPIQIGEVRAGLEARLSPYLIVSRAELERLEARVGELEAELAKVRKTADKAARAAKKPTGSKKPSAAQPEA